MKLCLGMLIHQGEAPYLRLHLPVIADCFDGAVIIIDPREALHDELHELDAMDEHDSLPGRVKVVTREFDNNWSEMLNVMVEAAEKCGYDAMLRLDPDEALFARDVDVIRAMLEHFNVLSLARYNFWGDRLHYDPSKYPDWQTRVFRLNCGAHYEGQHHERLVYTGSHHVVPTVNIYHFGWVGKQRILDKDFHYLNVAREKAGLPPLAERPADRDFPHWDNVLYTGEQPVDPYKVGIFAPYEE